MLRAAFSDAHGEAGHEDRTCHLRSVGAQTIARLMTPCIWLEDEMIEVIIDAGETALQIVPSGATAFKYWMHPWIWGMPLSM